MNKIEIAIVYSPQTGPDTVVFENEKGKVWHCKNKKQGAHNIGMGWYSIRDPEPEDSILVIEPKCVLDIDYDINFASKFNKIFTWAVKAFDDAAVAGKVVEINHPFRHHEIPPTFRQNCVKWRDKTDEIVFIANNKTSQHNSELYSLRIKMADMFMNHLDYKVSWYGQFGPSKPYYRGSLPPDGKIDILKRAKFSMCCENSYDQIFSYNYFTEKMPEVWLAGTIPIYMGCYNIDDLNLPKNSYIDLRKYVKLNDSPKSHTINYNGLIEKMNGYNNDLYTKTLDSIEQNLRDPHGLNYIVSWPRVYETIINAFL